MLTIQEAIVVEGRYDKNTLSQLVDTVIVELNGFAIFHNKDQLKLLRKLAQARGLIVLTDSDGAGFVLRNYLKGAIDPQWVKHAYIPDIYGKERRKATASKEGKLGVEGMTPAVLEQVLRQCGATIFEEGAPRHQPALRPITKGDLFALGLSGGANSAQKRQALLRALDLPAHLTANALVGVLNTITTYEALAQLVPTLNFDPTAGN